MDQMPPVVLLVEDEPLILLHSTLALEDAGYRAVAVADADAALAALGARDDIAAIFTDVNLPGACDGLGLARAVAAEHPGIAIVVTSGSTHVDPADVPGGRFLPKPYTLAQMTRALAAPA